MSFCCKTWAYKLGQCPSFQATRMQALESLHTSCPLQVPRTVTHTKLSPHCHSQDRAFISQGPLLNSYTHINTQLKCCSLQKGLPVSYFPICSHWTEYRRTGLRTGSWRKKVPFLFPREKGMGEGTTG